MFVRQQVGEWRCDSEKCFTLGTVFYDVNKAPPLPPDWVQQWIPYDAEHKHSGRMISVCPKCRKKKEESSQK